MYECIHPSSTGLFLNRVSGIWSPALQPSGEWWVYTLLPVTSTPPFTLPFTSQVPLEALMEFLHMHGLGVWEAAGGPQENLRRCRENKRTPHRNGVVLSNGC